MGQLCTIPLLYVRLRWYVRIPIRASKSAIFALSSLTCPLFHWTRCFKLEVPVCTNIPLPYYVVWETRTWDVPRTVERRKRTKKFFIMFYLSNGVVLYRFSPIVPFCMFLFRTLIFQVSSPQFNSSCLYVWSLYLNDYTVCRSVDIEIMKKRRVCPWMQFMCDLYGAIYAWPLACEIQAWVASIEKKKLLSRPSKRWSGRSDPLLIWCAKLESAWMNVI
jgi:hypothetical protein